MTGVRFDTDDIRHATRKVDSSQEAGPACLEGVFDPTSGSWKGHYVGTASSMSAAEAWLRGDGPLDRAQVDELRVLLSLVRGSRGKSRHGRVGPCT